MEEKVSIVIPIYNKEKYIITCLKSILKQTYKRLEIILIDDGSEDDSVNKVNEYIMRDSRMKLIKKQHEGVSSARNAGIKAATGKYILFVDADDELDENMVQKMVDKMHEGSGRRFVVTNIYRISKSKVISQCDECDKVFDFRSMDVNSYIEDYLFCKHSYCVWNKLFDLELIKEKKILFVDNEKYYPEDILFNLTVLLYTDQVIWINEPLYYHISCTGGLTNSERKNATIRYFNMCEYYKELLLKTDKLGDMHNSLLTVVQNIIISDIICLIRNNKCKEKELYDEIQKMRKYSFFQDSVSNIKEKHKYLIRRFLFFLLEKGNYRLFIGLFELIYKLRLTDFLLTRKRKTECLIKKVLGLGMRGEV